MKSPIPHRRGFTLLEILVALAMVALVAGAMVSSLRVAFKAQAAAERATDSARTLDVIFELMRDDLVSAVPRGATAVIPGDLTGTDNGTMDELALYTTASAPDRADANSDIKQVDWLLETPDGRQEQCLVRKVIRNLLSDTDVTPEEQVICRNVAALNFRYFDGTDWQDSWVSSDQGNELPSAIEVTIEMQPPDPATLPAGTLPQGARYIRVFRLPCSNLSASGLSGGGL